MNQAIIATAVAPPERFAARETEVHKEDVDIKSDLAAYFD